MATQREIATHLDLSPRRVRDVLHALNLPTRGPDLDETRKRYIRLLRDRASGHGHAGDGLDLAQERAKLAKAQREREQLAMQVRRGELVEAEPVRHEFQNAGVLIRSAVLTVPDRVAPIVAAESDERVVHDTITNELRQALTRLADEPEALRGQCDE